MSATRSVLVEAHRLEGWLDRFAHRNGPYAVEEHDDDGSLRIFAHNGCAAVLTPPLPQRTVEADTREPEALIQRLLTGIDPDAAVGLLLIRRGGYSVGVARGGDVLSSKTGTRYVQGRTAAGGWSQQRFARRRANQAGALVEETAARAATIFAGEPPSYLQLGGDKALAIAVLAEPALAMYAALPQVPFLTVPDPRFAVLKDAARSALSVRITVTDPPDDR